MKSFRVLVLLSFFAATIMAHAAPASAAGAASKRAVDRDELRASIRRGLDFLLRAQDPGGWWSTKDHPAVTGLVLTAFNQEPTGSFRERPPSELNRAFDFILTSAQADGSLHRGSMKNYNTALCLMALATAGNPGFAPVIRGAREFLSKSQIDLGEPGKLDTPFDGGVGYGSKYQHSDMNNTLVALEAMRLSESVERQPRVGEGKPADLNWEAAIHFLQACQNLPSHNPAEWVSKSPADTGGFFYYPGESMAGRTKDPVSGKVALRSYGSMSYGGLLSYIYAGLRPGDPRVAAVLQWLRSNYSLEENPGMGAQGYFYYLHLMTKALVAADIRELDLADGTRIDWRTQVARRLLSLQQPDGSWVNPEKRWWESDASVVTAYVLMTLEALEATASR